MIFRSRLRFLLVPAFVVSVLLQIGCETPQPRKTDAELGLNPQQARGRRVYDQHCDRCHEAYGKKERGGPSLQGVFRKPFLASGMRASDDRVADVVMMGKSKMPAYGNVISNQQLQDLLVYLHTL